MGVNLVALFPDPFFTINPHEDGCAHLFRGGGNKQYALEPAIAEYRAHKNFPSTTGLACKHNYVILPP